MTEHVKIDKPWGKGRIVVYQDSVADDSDKSVIVPTGKVWDVSFIRGDLTATATVGNRVLRISISDGVNIVFTGGATASIAASQRGVNLAGVGTDNGTTATYLDHLSGVTPNVLVVRALPDPFYLKDGYVVRVWDSAAVDAAADDLIVTIGYVEYDA